MEPIDYLIFGDLRQEYCTTYSGKAHLDVLGGSSAYAACGARVWSHKVGIASRVGSDFPPHHLESLTQAGISIQGVQILPEPMHNQIFYALRSPTDDVSTNPRMHFRNIGLPIPKPLAQWTSEANLQNHDLAIPSEILFQDLPPEVSSVRGVHIPPASARIHTCLPVRLREWGIEWITIDPDGDYMDPTHRDELPAILNGLDVFSPDEAKARDVFLPQEPELWEIMEAFGSMGVRYVVIKCGARGQLVWDHQANTRWHVPAYPARLQDTKGAGDAFCGGLLVGLEQSGDILEAVLRGNISASLAVEGTGALYILGAAPGLAQARLEAHRERVREM